MSYSVDMRERVIQFTKLQSSMLCHASKLREKKSILYRERDENKRKIFLENIASIDQRAIVYIYESEID